MEKLLRVAILDLNNNVPNRGVSYLKRLVESYSESMTYEVFDVRFKNEIPDTSFDIYLSSGGPGSPFDFDGGWDKPYFALLDELWQLNNTPSVSDPKFVFFICHSFQLACQHFKIGSVKERIRRSFGTFPCHLTPEGETELYFKGLPNPFWIADFRDWQVINADANYLNEQGFVITALEKERRHVNLPRAIMAVRFSEFFFGTQFHPEADAEGQERLSSMLEDLEDDQKIDLTHQTILPNFLNHAIAMLKNSLVEVLI
jgi:homoserine O-succinyltransferase/O-acetyltransferase